MDKQYLINGCGIVGVANFKYAKKEDLRSYDFSSMLNAIKHRGPDGYNIWSYENVQLGHTRLGIVDLSDKGSQPMVREHLVITYNGEIYNFKEIRNKLQKLGIKFLSQTDTEVIIRAYQIWKEDCVKEFDGMFAFCIYDISKNTIFFVRDHIGIKPLYYYIDNTYLLFSSEVKSLLKSNYIPKQLNYNLLYRQILFSSNLQHNIEQTLIKNVYSLLPGHYMTINLNDGSKYIKKYWDLPTQEIKLRGRNCYKEQVMHLQFLLEKSVNYRLVGDVPVASFLSGGLDSSTIAAVACKSINNSNKLNCFTVNYSSSNTLITESNCYEDLKYSNILVDFFKESISHNHVNVPFKSFQPNLLDDIIDFSALSEDPRLVSIMYNYKVINEHKLKVILNGQGADEIMGGYAAVNPIIRGAINDKYLKENVNKWFTEYYIQNFNILKRNVTNTKQETLDELYTFFDSLHGPVLRKAHCFLAKVTLHRILKFEDLLSMKFGVECRLPFLDKEILNWAFSIPFDHHINIKSKVGKILLKKVSAGYIPKAIIERPKKPFPNPDYKYISKDLIIYFNNNINDIKKSELIHDIYNNNIYEANSLSFRNLWLIISIYRWGRALDAL